MFLDSCGPHGLLSAVPSALSLTRPTCFSSSLVCPPVQLQPQVGEEASGVLRKAPSCRCEQPGAQDGWGVPMHSSQSHLQSPRCVPARAAEEGTQGPCLQARSQREQTASQSVRDYYRMTSVLEAMRRDHLTDWSLGHSRVIRLEPLYFSSTRLKMKLGLFFKHVF